MVKCKNCAFFIDTGVVSSDQNIGECHKNPPVLNPGIISPDFLEREIKANDAHIGVTMACLKASMFPCVGAEDRCGGFTRLSKDQRKQSSKE